MDETWGRTSGAESFSARIVISIFRTVDAGVQAGVEFKLKDNVGIQVKNYFGLMYDTLENNAAWATNDPLSPSEHDYKINRNNIFQINLCYYFSTGE